MKIQGIEIDPIEEEIKTVYKCPYCPKRFFHKGSIRNHLAKGYCWHFDLKYNLARQSYKNKEITTEQFYSYLYEKAKYEYILPTEEEKRLLSKELLKKIENLYCYDYDDI